MGERGTLTRISSEEVRVYGCFAWSWAASDDSGGEQFSEGSVSGGLTDAGKVCQLLDGMIELACLEVSHVDDDMIDCLCRWLPGCEKSRQCDLWVGSLV